ncbi:DNA-formamidopyrimidine glycosylase family protein [Frigoriflavimonas asaccharolytica]|uniref:Endonuclease-8 n=1 Tax=Frigoriflavimonas asaccharolytica TaxID=2735899 RepID=A0A8J8K9N5_9FLAO|nr:DNA-formamidopyrimidine glycosylase family protein [Frigoriflavimonas asaccharolytica]NRS93242.1 endonuclease-8 [Frigoriflavimonas asaccharolytica]
MPEGPTIKHFSRRLKRFVGKTVTEASGYGDMDKSRIVNIRLDDIETYGKNLIFVFKDFFVTAHFGLFGSMVINDRKKVNASFALHFADSEINFYVTKTKFYEGKPTDVFNFKTDILKPEFDADFILKELQEKYSELMIGDVLMDQNIFTGVGNIIRVEVLYHAKIHPDSLIKNIPEKKLIFLLKMVVDYSEEFLSLMKTGNVKESALVYGKKICPKDKTELLIEEMGKVKRKTYVCLKCQKLFK